MSPCVFNTTVISDDLDNSIFETDASIKSANNQNQSVQNPSPPTSLNSETPQITQLGKSPVSLPLVYLLFYSLLILSRMLCFFFYYYYLTHFFLTFAGNFIQPYSIHSKTKRNISQRLNFTLP